MSHPRCFVKKAVLRNFVKYTGRIKKEALTQVFFGEFWEISKKTFFTKDLWTTGSDLISKISTFILC